MSSGFRLEPWALPRGFGVEGETLNPISVVT